MKTNIDAGLLSSNFLFLNHTSSGIGRWDRVRHIKHRRESSSRGCSCASCEILLVGEFHVPQMNVDIYESGQRLEAWSIGRLDAVVDYPASYSFDVCVFYLDV